MNIINKTRSLHADPFAQSDRDPIGRHAGKGDRNRSITRLFSDRFPAAMGKNKTKGKFRKVYR